MLQVTIFVISCVLPSSKVPVALSCSVVPAASDGLVGVMAMEINVCAGRNVVAAKQNSAIAPNLWQFAGLVLPVPEGLYNFMGPRTAAKF